MTDSKNYLSIFAKASVSFMGIVTLFIILYITRGIVLPIIFSVIIAVLLHPVVNFFIRLKINRVIAISITLLITIVVLSVLSVLLFSQVSRFSESWPLLIDKFTELLNDTIVWASGYFDINPQKFHIWIAETKTNIVNSSMDSLGKTIVTVSGWFIVLFLVPVYIFLILLYQPLIIDFIHKLFNTSQHSQLNEMITQSKNVIQSYLVGLFMEFILILILYLIGFLVLGIQFAILLAVVGGLLNIIRYIGPFVAMLLFMAFALVTKSPVYVFYVFVLHWIIQLLDNFYIVPKIVASRVKLNALFSIIIIILGYELWGLSGMFLAIPLLAIIKLALDNIEPLKPWGFLLGDTMPPLIKIEPLFRRFKKIRTH
ncbi:MAG: AI-2E family transporter [Bacteroidales bacterium]|nr:AI-2E family transporter [Bacteroidales bacterium]